MAEMTKDIYKGSYKKSIDIESDIYLGSGRLDEQRG
jgi:hypothetical protein